MLHNEELQSLYHSHNILRVIKYRRLKWAGNLARMEEGRNFKKKLQLNLQETGLKRPRSRSEDNIKTDLKEMGVNTRNSIDSAQRLLESPCECGIEHLGP